jgi:uncharacterized phage-like protein YoqJ
MRNGTKRRTICIFCGNIFKMPFPFRPVCAILVATKEKEGRCVKICCFTGHRRLPRESYPALRAATEAAVRRAYAAGCRRFFAGGALGFDMLAAAIVTLLRDSEYPDITLTLLLPCRDQDADWSESQRRKYREILDSADEVIYASEVYTSTCMRERNLMLAEKCDILIAYVGYAASGSAQTARMAERLGRRVYNIYPTLDEKSRQNPLY